MINMKEDMFAPYYLKIANQFGKSVLDEYLSAKE